jgi:hypothetical protein
VLLDVSKKGIPEPVDDDGFPVRKKKKKRRSRAQPKESKELELIRKVFSKGQH